MLKVTLSSPPTHDQLVADVMFEAPSGSTQVAELARVNGELVITVFPPPDGQLWSFPVLDFTAAIETAMQQLSERLP
jgi:hypothetical protein